MPKNTDYDFIRSQMSIINAVKPQLELINSIQPQLDFINSNQSLLDFANSNQSLLAALASNRSLAAASVPIDPIGRNPAVLKSLEPLCTLQAQIDSSFFSASRCFVENPAFLMLAGNISNLVKNVDFPVQQLYESSQRIANASQRLDDIVSTLASNMENITISSEPESGSFIDLPEPVAEMFSDMDNSIELPSPDSEQNVHIDTSKIKAFFTVLGYLVGIFTLIFDIYSNNASTALSKQQHTEQMSEMQQQTEILKNIYNALSSLLNNDISLTSQKQNTEKCSRCQSDSE